jgi:hypothetical protein
MWRGIDAAPVNEHEARTLPDTPVPSKKIHQSREGGAALTIGVSGVVAAWTELSPILKQGTDLLPTLVSALGRPALLMGVIVFAAAAAVWVWRNERLEEEGA